MVRPGTKALHRTCQDGAGLPAGLTTTVDYMQTITLNNGVEMPRAGRRLPGPARRDPRRRPGRTHLRLPSRRHRCRLWQRAPGRRGGDQLRATPRRGLLGDEDLDQGYGYDQTLHGRDKSARELGVDRVDLLILHPATALGVRPGLGGWRPCSPRARPGPSGLATSWSNT